MMMTMTMMVAAPMAAPMGAPMAVAEAVSVPVMPSTTAIARGAMWIAVIALV